MRHPTYGLGPWMIIKKLTLQLVNSGPMGSLNDVIGSSPPSPASMSWFSDPANPKPRPSSAGSPVSSSPRSDAPAAFCTPSRDMTDEEIIAPQVLTRCNCQLILDGAAAVVTYGSFAENSLDMISHWLQPSPVRKPWPNPPQRSLEMSSIGWIRSAPRPRGSYTGLP